MKQLWGMAEVITKWMMIKMASYSHSRMHTTVSVVVTLGDNLFYQKKVSSPGQLFRTSLVFFISKDTCRQLIRWLVGSRTNESPCCCPGLVTNGGSLFHI